MKREELKEFILNLKLKHRFRYARDLKQYYKKEYKSLLARTRFLKGCSTGQRIYCFLNDIKDNPLCPTCKTNKLNFRGNGLGYYKFCSRSCARKNKEIEEKRKNTCFERYGYYHNLAKDSPMQKKMIKNLQQKYGVINVSQIKEVKEKKRKTFQKNHKEPHPLWGNTWYDVNIDGNIYRVQGYERFAIYDIIEKYGINDVKIDYKSIKKKTGEIKYNHNGKNYRYYPDFYIISENKIIEVKSIFTLKENIDITIDKIKACIDRGYNFEILIYNYKGEIINEEKEPKRLLERIELHDSSKEQVC